MFLTRKEAKDISDMALCGQGPSELMRTIESKARQGETSLHGQHLTQKEVDGLIALGYSVVNYRCGYATVLWGDEYFE